MKHHFTFISSFSHFLFLLAIESYRLLLAQVNSEKRQGAPSPVPLDNIPVFGLYSPAALDTNDSVSLLGMKKREKRGRRNAASHLRQRLGCRLISSRLFS